MQRRPSQEGAWLGKKWGMEKPLEHEFEDPEYDCVWGLGDSDAALKMYFETLKKDEGQAYSARRASLYSPVPPVLGCVAVLFIHSFHCFFSQINHVGNASGRPGCQGILLVYPASSLF